MADDELSEHVVRLREDAQGWRKVDGPRLGPDDPFLTGLGEEEAERLVQTNWALRRSGVDEAREFYESTDGDDSSVEFDGDDFAENGWLDNNYQDRADAVLAGGLDEYLDEIEEAETSETVIEAVEERRAELNEEG